MNNGSVWNNMVNTTPHRDEEFKIGLNEYTKIVEECERSHNSFSLNQKASLNIKSILGRVGVVAGIVAALGGVAYVSHIQYQNAEENMQVVYSEEMPQMQGIKFEITRNGIGYFVDNQGNHLAEVDNINAQQRANQYIESGYINLPNKTK